MDSSAPASSWKTFKSQPVLLRHGQLFLRGTGFLLSIATTGVFAWFFGRWADGASHADDRIGIGLCAVCLGILIDGYETVKLSKRKEPRTCPINLCAVCFDVLILVFAVIGYVFDLSLQESDKEYMRDRYDSYWSPSWRTQRAHDRILIGNLLLAYLALRALYVLLGVAATFFLLSRSRARGRRSQQEASLPLGDIAQKP